MLRPPALALAAGLALAAAAAEPPLLRPANPPAGHTRVRFPLKGGEDPVLQFVGKGKVPRAGGKKGDLIDVSVSLSTVPHCQATDKMLARWGYKGVPNESVILPEVFLTGSQLSPKLAKGADVVYRIPSVKVWVVDVDANGKSEQISGTDLMLHLPEITGGADRVMEPRLYFTDRFLDLSLPAATFKKPNTGAEAPADPPSKAPAGLTPFVAPLTDPKGPAFAGATINGQDTVKVPGKAEPLVVYLSASTEGMEDFYVSLGAAQPLGVKVDPTKTGFEKARVQELRLVFNTGPGFKAKKEFVLTDTPVNVNMLDSSVTVAIGPTFVNKHFPDAVFTVGSDGAAKLHGRVDPKKLAEVRPRKK
jgi:hypothetical protein